MTDMNAAASHVAAEEGAIDIRGGVDAVSIPETCVTAVYSVQKLAALLQKGEDSQILFALGELAQLLENCLEDTLVLFVPSVCEFAPRWSTEVQLRAGRELLGIERDQLSSEVGRCIALSSVLVIRTIDNSNIPVAAEMYDVWGQLASKSVEATAWQAKDLSAVLRFVDHSTKSPFSEERRAAVGFCQGMCKCRRSNLDVRSQGFSRLWTFAKDPSMDVLAKCLEVMGECSESFTDAAVSESIWPLVQRAWADDPKSVASSKSLLARAAAVKCASQLCEARFTANKEGRSRETVIDTAAVHQLLARLFLFAEAWSVKDQRELNQELYIAEIAVAEYIVKLLYFASEGARHSRSSFSMKAGASVFAQLAQVNGPGIREKCAFNMPAMAHLMAHDKAGVAMLTSCCSDLAFDSEDIVRLTLAKGLHETFSGLVQKGSVEKMYGTVLDLLQDESHDVSNSVIEHISECLITLATAGRGKAIDKQQIINALEKASLALSKRNWRVSKIFSQQVANLCRAFPTLGLEQLVIPILFEIVSATGSCEVRSEAAKSIVTISRTVPEEAVRDKYVKELLQSLSDGSHKTRICAVDCGVHALSVYSEVLFSQLFAAPVLRLADDKVPNVRIRVAKALPQLAPWCQTHELFEPALAKLRADEDEDVRDVMQSFVLRASQYVTKSKDEEEEVYSRRVDEVLYYSSAGATLSLNGALGPASRQVTPKSIPTKVKEVVQQSRLGKRLAEIASLRSQDTDHEDLARAYSMTETHGREDLVSISGPSISGMQPTSNVMSVMSWASEERSADAYFLRNEEGRTCPATVRAPPAHVKPAEAGGEDKDTAPKSVLDFSAVLSGNLSSFGEPLTADMPSERHASQSGAAISRGQSRGRSSQREQSHDRANATKHKSRLNTSAQALPVQALVKTINNRRSRHLPGDDDKRLVNTFSKDSAFSAMSSEDDQDQFEQDSLHQIAESKTQKREEEVSEQRGTAATPPKSLLRRLASALGFGRAKSASAPAARLTSLRPRPSANRAPAAAESETHTLQQDSVSKADPPKLPAAPALRTMDSAPAAASSAADAAEPALPVPATKPSVDKIAPAQPESRATARKPVATSPVAEAAQPAKLMPSTADRTMPAGSTLLPLTAVEPRDEITEKPAHEIAPKARAPPPLATAEPTDKMMPEPPPPPPVAAEEAVDDITSAVSGPHGAPASKAVAHAKSDARSSLPSASIPGSELDSGPSEYNTAMHIPAPASPSAESSPVSLGAKAAGLLAPLRRRQPAGGTTGSGSGSGLGSAPRGKYSSSGSPRSLGRQKVAELGAGLGAGLRTFGRRRSSSDAAGAGGAGAAGAAGGEESGVSTAPRGKRDASPERLPQYRGSPPWERGQAVQERREEEADADARASAAEEDRATVEAAERGQAPVASLTALWERA